MRIHITADMEGVSCVCHDNQVGQKDLDYPRMRRLMTDEVKAATEGAFDGGADGVVVCDAHDTCRNILVEELEGDVEVIQGDSFALGMMAGIDRNFDASFQVGYHSMRHTPEGTLGHTYTFDISALRFNGTTIGETGLSAAIAGHFGVPLVFVSGDVHATRQAEELVKGVVTVPTKEGIGVYGARFPTPKKACELIRKGAREAMGKVHEIEPLRFEGAVNMEVAFEKPLMALYASGIPGTRRIDEFTVSYTAVNPLEAFKVFRIMTMVSGVAKEEGPI